MSLLKIYPAVSADEGSGYNVDTFDSDDRVRTFVDADIIARELQAIGVQFERWQTGADLSADASTDAILTAYHEQVEALKHEHGFVTADVVSLGPTHPDRQALRQKFLSEHTHSDFEVRFFVAGQGLFYIHHDDSVYAILCQQGDLISVPAGMRHWFDMGPQSSFTCIRLFNDPAGWVAEYTGSTIADHYPKFDQFMSVAA